MYTSGSCLVDSLRRGLRLSCVCTYVIIPDFPSVFKTSVLRSQLPAMVLSYAWSLIKTWLRGTIDTEPDEQWGPWTSTVDTSSLCALAAVSQEFHVLVTRR